MNKYEKMKRNEEIRETLKKILHVVSYVLSVAFIVLMVIVGAQSCSNNKNNVATQNNAPISQKRLSKAFNYNKDEYYVYEMKDFTHAEEYGLELPLDAQESFLHDFRTDLSVYTQYEYEQGYVSYDFSVSGSYIFDGVSSDFNYFTLVFYNMPYVEDEDLLYWSFRLKMIQFYGDYNNTFLSHYTDNGVDYANYLDYTFQYNQVKVVINDYPLTLNSFLYFFEEVNRSNFTFDINFNYNAPSLMPIGNQLWKEPGLTDFETDHYSDLNIGWFYSNGSIYDTIRYVYWNSDGQFFAPSVAEGNNGNGFWGADNYAFYVRMEYYNSSTHASSVVNVRDKSWKNTSQSGLMTYFYVPTTTWRDSGYRSITLLTNLTDEQRILLNSFNNGSGSVVNTDVVTYTDMGNVFSLVGSAFTSILPVLNVMVLPGITLGILMFIPLVAMLVFAIIRIIKK